MLYHHYFVMTSYHWNAGKTCQCKQRKQSNCLMFIHSYYESRIHGNFQGHSFNISGSCMVHISIKNIKKKLKSVVGRLYSDIESDRTVT